MKTLKKIGMFEYSKKILNKVSFDSGLFKKELKKSISWVKKEERTLLKIWCLATFGNDYLEIITEVFKSL
jgi:hypothetical protein